MSIPLVSVVIPTYNQPRLLTEAIDSVLAQTMTDFEIVIVNDGSTEDTLAELAKYGNRIRIITQENGGIGVARNRGIDEARGKYVALLDHDDYWMPDKLAIQSAFLEANSSCIGATVVYASSQYPDVPAAWPNQISGPDRIITDPFGQLAAGRLFIGTSALMFARERAGGVRYGTVRGAIEDVQFHVQLLARGPFGIAGDRVLAIWRVHETNSSRATGYDYSGVKLLRAMDERGEFREVPARLRPSLLEYFGLLGRNTASGQLLGGHRGRGMEMYFREFLHQARLRRWKFLAAFPLMTVLPRALLVHQQHKRSARAVST